MTDVIAADPAALGIRTDGDRSGLARRMTLVLVAAVILVTFLVDLAYAAVDPRLRRR